MRLERTVSMISQMVRLRTTAERWKLTLQTMRLERMRLRILRLLPTRRTSRRQAVKL